MKQYYYINSYKQQVGPVSAEDLRQANITADTMVWYEGLPKWVTASSLIELQPYLTVAPPPFVQSAAPAPAKPDSHLVWAILTTLLCCQPFGIVAIVYASKVDSYWASQRYDEALDASRKAKNWSIASAAISLVGSVIYIFFVFLGVMAGL